MQTKCGLNTSGLFLVPDKPVVKIEHFGCEDNSVTLSWCLPTNSQAADGFKLEMDNGSNGPFKVRTLTEKNGFCLLLIFNLYF